MKRCGWLMVLLWQLVATAQVNSGFVEHLAANGLYTEHRAYLDRLPKSDSSDYYEAKFYLRYFNDSLFMQHYAASSLCAADPTLTAEASKLFFTGSTAPNRNKWFTLTAVSLNANQRYFQKAYRAAQQPMHFTTDSLPEELHASFLGYKKMAAKKPVLGACLSAVVPGLGKLYAGKKKSALMTFLLNAGYAAQTIESANKLGLKHPFTLVNAGLFTLFYASNIYGGYSSISDLKKERKKQFLYDAARLYN